MFVSRKIMSEQKEKFLQRLAEISAELSQENNSSPAVSLDHDFSLKKPFLSDRTIEELLEEGYIGQGKRILKYAIINI